ncbi:MAG: hypothetical protein ACK4UR_04570, partial [Caldimicrobium sp.]
MFDFIFQKKSSSSNDIETLEPKKKSLFDKFKEGLSKTKERLSSLLEDVFEVDKLLTLSDLEDIEEKF